MWDDLGEPPGFENDVWQSARQLREQRQFREIVRQGNTALVGEAIDSCVRMQELMDWQKGGVWVEEEREAKFLW